MDTKERKKSKNSLGAIGKSIRESIKNDGMGVGSFRLWINIGATVIGFLFAGCHTLFGAYPLGVAFVSALPSFVWPGLLGAVLGSLTLGRGGMIYAMICVLSVFLRIIISGGSDEKSNEEMPLFSEPVALRVSAALISGFVAAVYEILLGGIRLESVLFGSVMMLISALMTFVFSGAFYHGIGVKALIFGSKRIFDTPEEPSERQQLLFFKISLAVYVAFISLSLSEYNVFGIDLSFVFAGCVTLFAAKRFGALVGASVGFLSSVIVSGVFSPAFALFGIIAGALFPYGTRYAAAAGGAVLSLWGSYMQGVSGFLSLLPEYLISLCIVAPMLKSFEREDREEDVSIEKSATDMVGTMALAYRNRQQLVCEKIESSFKNLVPLISAFLPSQATSEDYSAFLKIVTESKNTALSDREIDGELTEALIDLPRELGFKSSVIRAFGGRRKHVILAAEDRDGTMITTPELKAGIEKASGLAFGTPTYYRRQNMALMECETVAKYRINAIFLTESGTDGEISGDSVSFFETDSLYAYGVISDGMGSGAVAKRTADFTVDFLKQVSSSGASFDTALHMINAVIRRQSEECSVGFDVFAFDMITGDAEFIKSGAAASYVKRNGALYRIKSETIPMGVIKRVDAEKIKVSVHEGDVVIMTSDGICEPSSDAPWLVEYLNRDISGDIKTYAAGIIEAAKKYNKKRDDMSVLVMSITKT